MYNLRFGFIENGSSVMFKNRRLISCTLNINNTYKHIFYAKQIKDKYNLNVQIVKYRFCPVKAITYQDFLKNSFNEPYDGYAISMDGEFLLTYSNSFYSDFSDKLLSKDMGEKYMYIFKSVKEIKEYILLKTNLFKGKTDKEILDAVSKELFPFNWNVEDIKRKANPYNYKILLLKLMPIDC